MTAVRFHPVTSAPIPTVLAFIPHGATVYLKGAVRIKVVFGGAVRVLGASVDASSPEQTVYSPRGFSLLGIEAVAGEGHGNPYFFTGEEAEQSFAWSPDLVDMVRKRATCENCVAVVMKRVDEEWLQFVARRFRLTANHTASLFGSDKSDSTSDVEKSLNVKFYGIGLEELCEPPGRIFRENSDWETAVKSAVLTAEKNRTPRVLVAGGKGVGKSSFLRCYVNRLRKLLNAKSVLYLDLDPGQAEFTIPGCVSATVVSSNLLGPNFCHVSSFKQRLVFNLGQINVANCVESYLEALRMLAKTVKEDPALSSMPTCINTMGFNVGLGAHIMKETVRLFCPSTLVVLSSRHANKNYRLDFERLLPDRCNLLTFAAMPESEDVKMTQHDLWGIPEPRKLRDLVVLAFLARFPQLSGDCKRIGFGHLAVQVAHSEDNGGDKSARRDLPDLINASLVSLSHVPPEVIRRSSEKSLGIVPRKHVAQCLGFGVVRGVDREKSSVYIVTDLEDVQLRELQVNCVTVGCVRLPDSVFKCQVVGAIRPPYLSRVMSSNPMAEPWKRSGKPKANFAASAN